jgi:transcriptional regulator with XRE-family HTH domain
MGGDAGLYRNLPGRCPNFSKSPHQQIGVVVTRIVVCVSMIVAHGASLSTYMEKSQAIFVEKSPTIVGGDCEIFEFPMIRRTLAEYVDQVMIDNGDKPKDVEARAKRAGFPISDATIGKILLEQVKNPGILTLRALAHGLGRPIEEVVAAALGELPAESRAFRESDLADLFNVYHGLSTSDQKFYKRCFEMLRREMLSR